MSLKILKNVVSFAANPAGFLIDQVTGRIIETDKDGKPLPEMPSLFVKIDRQNAYLAFIAEQMNPEKFAEIFGQDPPDEEEKPDPDPEPETVDAFISGAPAL